MSSILPEGHWNGVYIEDAQKPWSLTATGPTTFRLELRAGDHWADDYSTSIQRTNILLADPSNRNSPGFWTAGTPVDISYNLKVEPGQANTASWLLLNQVNILDNPTSPPFAVEMVGEHMRIVIRSGNPHTGAPQTTLWQDPNPIQRGHSYAMDIQLKFGADGTGYLHVWRDGAEIVNYQGPIGYGQQTYDFGETIYRPNAPETMAVEFSNMKITTPSYSQILTSQGFVPASNGSGDPSTGGSDTGGTTGGGSNTGDF